MKMDPATRETPSTRRTWSFVSSGTIMDSTQPIDTANAIEYQAIERI